MNPIEFNYTKLRAAQDLPKKTLETIGMKLLQKNKEGIYTMPEESAIAAYINSLCEKREIRHFRLKGEHEEIFLLDPKDVEASLEIMEVEAKKTPDVIKIRCYDEKIDSNDDVPYEIAGIEELFKLPKSLFNSGTCIYFLCRGLKCVYVGQAENVHQRLIEHMKTKEFDSVFYLRVPANKMNKYEAALISYLKPEYNRTSLKGSNSSQSLALSILNRVGVSPNPIGAK